LQLRTPTSPENLVISMPRLSLSHRAVIALAKSASCESSSGASPRKGCLTQPFVLVI
jgi:hypothetical protein